MHHISCQSHMSCLGNMKVKSDGLGEHGCCAQVPSSHTRISSGNTFCLRTVYKLSWQAHKPYTMHALRVNFMMSGWLWLLMAASM